jgi:response regulator RpfG family c-di-GMP phosphodiesterase
MLKRIVVIGEGGEMGTLTEAAQGHDMQLVTWAMGESLPPGAAAAMGAGEGLIAAAGAVAAQHEGLIALLADALDVREGLSPGCSRRVHEHCVRFSKALGLEGDERHAFESAGYLREIGKLRISNEVLLKKSVLTYEEWILMQRHTSLGAELLTEAGLFTHCADIVHYHHECWDGTGYPERLEGESIPRLARAMRIIDVYCAMTSPRTYRKGVTSHESALEHMKSERDKHFDPELLDVFLNEGIARPVET